MCHFREGEKLFKKDLEKAKAEFGYCIKLHDLAMDINPTMFNECFNLKGFIFSMVPSKDELTNGDKFNAPHYEGAPHIDLSQEEKK